MTPTPRLWAKIRARLARARAHRAAARATGSRLEPDDDSRALALRELALARYKAAKRCSDGALLHPEYGHPSVYDFADWLIRRSGLVAAAGIEDLEALLGEVDRLVAGRPWRFPVRDSEVESVPWWVAERAWRDLRAIDPTAPTLQEIAESGGLEPEHLERAFPLWRHADRLLERMIELELESDSHLDPEPTRTE